MSDDLIEKVAQAIYAESFGDGGSKVWEAHAGDSTKARYRRLAAAAVQVVQDQLAPKGTTMTIWIPDDPAVVTDSVTGTVKRCRLARF